MIVAVFPSVGFAAGQVTFSLRYLVSASPSDVAREKAQLLKCLSTNIRTVRTIHPQYLHMRLGTVAGPEIPAQRT